MRRTLLASLLVTVPSIAFALNYDDLTDRYSDRPFSTAETAGISVLTEIGAVSGNPDGSFAAERTLNRAEFVKIALLASNASMTDATGCFPDTPAEAWFAKYVCTAFEMDVVEGNPDGLFHPERPVNYAEAVKILDILYGYTLPEPAPNERWAWYTGYLKAAAEHKVSLPGSVEAGDLLTRGQMARLAAAFVAEDEGELDAYRAFEKGTSLSSSSSSSSESSASSESSSSSSSVSSSSSFSSSSSSIAVSVPAISRFLVAATSNNTVYDGVAQAIDEDERVQSVTVELFRQIHSLSSLRLVDENGTVIANLELQGYSNTDKKKWRADLQDNTGYVFQKGVPVRIALQATMKSVNDTISSEIFELKYFNMYTGGIQSNSAGEIIPTDIHQPSHQTAFGSFDMMRNDLADTLSMKQGTARTLGTFALSGHAAEGTVVRGDSLTFTLQTTDVSVSKLKIGGSAQVDQIDCAIEQGADKTLVICPLPQSMQTLSGAPVTVMVYGDVTVATAKQSGIVQLQSFDKGTMERAGVVRWNDGVSAFSWVQADALVENGPLITVSK